MNRLLIIFGGLLLVPVIGVRLLFLVRGRLGWITYLTNTFSEFFVKKLHWSRTVVEIVLAVAGVAMLGMSGIAWGWVCAAALLLLALELYVSKVERWMLTATWTPIDRIGLGKRAPEATRGLARGYPEPSTHPELTVNLLGPFVERMPEYRLGSLMVGRSLEMRLVIGNHTLVPTQTDIRVRVEGPEELSLKQQATQMASRLETGQVHVIPLSWTVRAARGRGRIRIVLEWGHFRRDLLVHFDQCVEGKAQIASAAITRYPGGCRSAFAWRGDMDLYDESTLQSIEGLAVTLGLAARYRIPQTMYLSTRLSLDSDAAQQYSGHYGCDRGASHISGFVEWMRRNVDFRHVCAYPFAASKPFLMELGNHGHLHFGTDAAAAPENGWKRNARMGDGVYRWLGDDRSSFGEQRDNALETRRLCEDLFNYTPKSWAMPDRTNDRHTPAAMEAAGCEVLSDSDAGTLHNVLLQPPPHHPNGTSAVELTKRYPGDPQHAYHVAMILFWIHRAHRKGIPVVFMCHQHMRQFDGYACTRLTEYILRYVLSRFHGDLHVNTVYGIGKYWREVLSPTKKRVQVMVEGSWVRIRNNSDADLVDAPLDIVLKDGSRFAVLVNVAAGGEIHLRVDGRETEPRISSPALSAG